MALFTLTNAFVYRVNANNIIRILPDGTIDPLGAPILTTDKITYRFDAPNILSSISVERNNIIVDGLGYALTGDGTGNGFTIISVNNVTIKNTKIQNFTYGIYIEAATSTLVRDNNLTANTYDGIGAFYSYSTKILANRITANAYDGIEIYNCSDNDIQENYIATNAWFGISLYEYSTGNVTRNKIMDNYSGLELSYSSNVRIFHNDFVNQTLHASTQFSQAIWDNGYPSGGNYWSNYTSSDLYSGPFQNETGSDEIADTPFNCSGNNQDRYPLMNAFANLAVKMVLPAKTIVGQGYNATMQVIIENEGWAAQTTSILMYANTTLLANFTNLPMMGRTQTTLTVIWQTSFLGKGNYTINTTASRISNETDTIDNNCTLIVHVGVPGDVSGSIQGAYDGLVNMRDISYLILQFNSRPNSPNWKPNADINNDSVINMRDISIAILNFNKHE